MTRGRSRRVSRVQALAGTLALVAASYVVWLAVVGAFAYEPLRLAARGRASAGYPWRGAVHVHTRISADATGTLEEVVAAAARAGLDFVVIADHTRARGLAGRVEGGWVGDVFVVVGEEISTDNGHLVAMGPRPHPYALGPTARQTMADVEALEGWSLIAHPDDQEDPWTGGWLGADATEVLNLSTVAHRAAFGRLLRTAMIYPVNPALALSGLIAGAPTALQDWDRHTRLSGGPSVQQRLAAVASADAHGPFGPLRWLGMPSYESLLAAITNVVWLDEPAPTGTGGGARVKATSDAILEALRVGRSAVVVEAIGVVPGFDFFAAGPAGASASSGDEVVWAPGWTFEATMGLGGGSRRGGAGGAAGEKPGGAAYEIRLLRDGELVSSVRDADLSVPASEPGTYRVEVARVLSAGAIAAAVPWIISNPIYLWPQSAITAAVVRRAPVPPAPPTSVDLLDEPGWQTDQGDDSVSALAAAEHGLRWDLRLPRGSGEELSEVDGAFAALAWRALERLDWSSRGGLVVHMSSLREWRVGLRVWVRLEGGGEATWEYVLPSLPESNARGVPWSLFRRLDGSNLSSAAGESPLLDHLASVSGVGLVVTPLMMRPGTEATIDLLEMGLYGGAH